MYTPKTTEYRVTFPNGDLAGVHMRQDSAYAFAEGKHMWWEQHGRRGSAEMPLYGHLRMASVDARYLGVVVEGEKAAEALWKAGIPAFGTVTGAATIPCDESLRPLLEYDVVTLWPDNDKVGKQHMDRIAARLVDLGARCVRIAAWEAAPEHGDAADYFAAGATLEQAFSLLERAPVWVPAAAEESPAEEPPASPAGEAPQEDPPHAAGTNSLNSLNLYFVDTHKTFPDPPDPGMYFGLAGDIVGAIEPHSESDPVGLLLQLLTAFGNIVGRHSYVRAEEDRHYANLSVVVVGDTSRARKGTSFGHIKKRVETALGPQGVLWVADHIKPGLSSGEGIVHALRDTPKDSDARAFEPLLTDKRLLAFEAEFASVLKVMTREGNTLSDTLRKCWDGAPLGTITKHTPEKASHHYVSLIGHITKDELVRLLTDTESANGFGNRLLFVSVTRSNFLPFGGKIDTVNFKELDERLGKAYEFAAKGEDREVRFHGAAATVFAARYKTLSAGQPGLLGALTARAEAQVLRLALIYSLLDCSKLIRVEHLRAALAVWDYVERSTRAIFSDALGSPDADAILGALRGASPHGLSRTDISNLFGRNLRADRLQRALVVLLTAGLDRVTHEDTGGKKAAEVWYAVGPQ